MGTKKPIAKLDAAVILNEGVKGLVRNGAIKEASSPKALRGGNSGALIDGVVYGNCARLTHLRFLGYQGTEPKSTQIMFSVGRSLENVLLELLEASGFPMERVKRESEVPVSYTHESGIPITGRPDFILFDEEGKPATGIECKGKMSYYGLRNVLIEDRADTSHLIQAAHYMWAHELSSYTLSYVAPAKYPIPAKDKESWDQLGEEWVERREGMGPVSTYPSVVNFSLFTGDDGCLHIITPRKSTIKTKLKWEHIQAFYSSVTAMGPGKPLPPPPTAKEITKGSSWKKCQYCSLSSLCDSNPTYEHWLDGAVDKVTESWAEHWPDLLDEYLEGWEQK